MHFAHSYFNMDVGFRASTMAATNNLRGLYRLRGFGRRNRGVTDGEVFGSQTLLLATRDWESHALHAKYDGQW